MKAKVRLTMQRKRSKGRKTATICLTGEVGGRAFEGEMPTSTARQLGANLINLADDVECVGLTGVVDFEVDE